MDNSSGRSSFITTLISGVVGIPVFFVLIVLLSSLGAWLVFIFVGLVAVVTVFVLVNRYRSRKFLEEYYSNYDPSLDEDN